MDKPATVLAAVIGLVLIAASLPFLILDGGSEDDRFTISWGEAQAENGSAQRALTGTGTFEAPIRFDSIIASNATVTITCEDGATPPLHSAATVTWQLEDGNGTVIGQGTGCPSGERVVLGAHPDVGAATADSADDAETVAEADAGPAEYVLVVTVNRPNPPGGLPVPPPTFSGQATLTILEWVATANEPEEATR